MIFCTQCGAPSSDQSTFCSNCGSQLTTPTPTAVNAAATPTFVPMDDDTALNQHLSEPIDQSYMEEYSTPMDRLAHRIGGALGFSSKRMVKFMIIPVMLMLVGAIVLFQIVIAMSHSDRPPELTYSKYLNIDYDMTLDEVNDILGRPGVMSSSRELDGVGTIYLYVWEQTSPTYLRIEVEFLNGEVFDTDIIGFF